MSKTQTWITQESKVCAQYYQPIPVVIERGEGAWLYDIENNKYLDMMSAYSATSFGHAHPRLTQTLIEQAKKLCVTSRAFHCATLKPFLAKLASISGLDMAAPMNTGAEAVEVAIKAARRWGYKHKGISSNKAKIIVAKNNFHGRTITITSFSTEPSYKEDFGPFTPGFEAIDFGDEKALENAIDENTCAFLVEPMQGEAGILIPHKGYLKKCEQICKDNNVLFILDEIQTGLGRTGKLFAFQHENIKPDGLILGKALGGGMLAVSALLGKQQLMEVFNPGSHGSTFGGNALAAKVGLAALETIEEEGLVERSEKLGVKLIQELKNIKHPAIKDVRGSGLWVGVELDPEQISAYDCCVALSKNGVLTKEAHDTVIRFAPPLIIEEKDLSWAVSQFAKTLDEMT
jgi:ornithine--oxo-acid transaminase